MSVPLILENLHEFDGGSLAHLFDRGARDIYLDLDDRAKLKKARKLTIEISFTPSQDEGELEEVEVSGKVKLSIPDHETRVNTILPSRQSQGMVFDGGSRRTTTLPNQIPMSFEGDEK